MTAIITCARDRRALIATRSLGKKNIDVITSDSIYPAMSFFSRYSKSYFKYPSHKVSPYLFINSLRNYAQRKHADVLIPIEDETYIISKYKERFNSNLKIPIAEHQQILNANNKLFMMKVANDIGIPIPETFTISDISQLKSIAKKMRYPVVIKLISGSGARGLTVVSSEGELIKKYKMTVQEFGLKPFEYPIIQEFIPGFVYGVTMLFNQGDPRALLVQKITRQLSVNGGPNTSRVSVRHDVIEKYATKILKDLDWHGVAEVEFKLNENTGTPFFLEVNPRIAGIATPLGVDIPYLLYKMAIEGDVERMFNYKTGVITKWFLGDLWAIWSRLFDSKEKKELFKEFLKFFGRDIHFDELCIEDPIPAFVEPLFPLIQLLKTGKLSFAPLEER